MVTSLPAVIAAESGTLAAQRCPPDDPIASPLAAVGVGLLFMITFVLVIVVILTTWCNDLAARRAQDDKNP